ncbi:hypothetical protein MAPG_02666 [Magnaporthiopsis poae ATCC 64411]|uniref:DNA mismatch repair protein S5 domain-containing protein n=1 Tax=Magnaporthiopsis poae (strain ATCC 64411 / 73-15) TaxID=644358 RepID=A0A0C4DRZ8_MAGP6|nr:hypothetical protein MAPG_02666 [Magnaporthiopsis poae ATCC 64411]
MPIVPLPQDAARLLRAHVVISTPLSVVKELVDNAIDAGASAIEVRISPNTVDRIEVRDNGGGISPSDYDALGRSGHTSKIASLEELKALGGTSLGFRGEAIAAMCAVAKVTVTTKTAVEKMAAVFELLPMGKGPLKPASKPTPVGTTLTVTDLFARYPVRRKAAIKDSRPILIKIKQLLAAYALARPCLRISLREIGSSSSPPWSYSPRPGSGIKEATLSLFGRDLAAQCTESSSSSPSTHECVEDATEGVVRIEAFIPGPNADPAKISKGSFLAVDARPVSSARGTFKKIVSSFRKHLRHCLDTSSNTALKDPFIALNIVCPTGTYDVNLEPAKDDVLFVDEQVILRACDRLFERVYKPLGSGGDQQDLAGSDARDICDQVNPRSNDTTERTQASTERGLRSCAGPPRTGITSTRDNDHREAIIMDPGTHPAGEQPQSRTTPTAQLIRSKTPPALEHIARRALNWSVNMDANEISEDDLHQTADQTGCHPLPTEDDEASRPLDGVNPWMLAKMNAAARPPHPPVPALRDSHSSSTHPISSTTLAPGDALREAPPGHEGISPHDSISTAQDQHLPGSGRSLRHPPVQAHGAVPGGPFRSHFSRGGHRRQPQRINPQQQDDTSNAPLTPPPSARAGTRIRGQGLADQGQMKSIGARYSMQQTRLPSWNHERPSRSRVQKNTTYTPPSNPPSTRRNEATTEREFLEGMSLRPSRPPREETLRGTAALPSFTSAWTVLKHSTHRETDSSAAPNLAKGDSQRHIGERPLRSARGRKLNKPLGHSQRVNGSALLELPTKYTLGLLSMESRLASVDNYMLTGTIQYGLKAIDAASKAQIEKLLHQRLAESTGGR